MSEEWYEIAREDFEGEFPAYEGISELQAAEGWTPVWLEDPQDGVLDRPEFKPAGAAQAAEGENAQAIHGAFSTIDGAIAKRFPVIEGNEYFASVQAMGLTDEAATDQPMMGMAVLVDLSGGMNYGGTFPKIESSWWSQDNPAWESGKWMIVSTEGFIAQSNYVTVYLKVANRFAARTHAHFDEFILYGSEDSGGSGNGGEVSAELLAIAEAQLALSMRIRDLASEVGGGSSQAKSLIEEAEGKLQEAKAIL